MKVHKLHVRLSEEENAMLEKWAKQKGCSRSEVVRQLINLLPEPGSKEVPGQVKAIFRFVEIEEEQTGKEKS